MLIRIPAGLYRPDSGQVLLDRGHPAAADAEVLDLLTRRPHGLDRHLSNWTKDPRGRQGSGFPGGRWQRLAMARNF